VIVAGIAHAPVSALAQSPADGSAFKTTDTVRFEHPDAAGGDRNYVFALTPDRADGWLSTGPETAPKVDLGWVATKFDHLGRFYWSACTTVLNENDEEVLDECTSPLSFSVRFRFATLKTATARQHARAVMRHRFRSYWVAGYNRKVSCRRRSRIRQRCRVSAAVGDVVLRGTVWIYPKRKRTFELPYFRAVVKIVDEYCHAVRGEPLSACTTTRRRRGSVY
jgi:hypothetical protein